MESSTGQTERSLQCPNLISSCVSLTLSGLVCWASRRETERVKESPGDWGSIAASLWDQCLSPHHSEVALQRPDPLQRSFLCYSSLIIALTTQAAGNALSSQWNILTFKFQPSVSYTRPEVGTYFLDLFPGEKLFCCCQSSLNAVGDYYCSLIDCRDV